MLDNHIILPFREVTGLGTRKGVLEGAVRLNGLSPYIQLTRFSVIVLAKDPDPDSVRVARCGSGDQVVVTSGKSGTGSPDGEGRGPQLDGGRGEPGIDEVVLPPGLRDRIDRVAAGIKRPGDVAGVPLVRPGVVGLDILAREGRRVAVLHRGRHVQEHSAVGREVRAGQEEVDGVAVGAGPGERDLLADGVDAGSGCDDGDDAPLDPHLGLVVDLRGCRVLDADREPPFSSALVGVELDGTGAGGGGCNGHIGGAVVTNAHLAGCDHRVLTLGKALDIPDEEAVVLLCLPGDRHGETLAACDDILIS